MFGVYKLDKTSFVYLNLQLMFLSCILCNNFNCIQVTYTILNYVSYSIHITSDVNISIEQNTNDKTILNSNLVYIIHRLYSIFNINIV